MSNPAAQSDAAGEYIEVFNAGTAVVDLFGMTVRDDGSDSFTVADSLPLAPGEYAVLGKSSTAAGGAVDYVYGNTMTLSNSMDEIVLILDGVVLDSVAYDSGFSLVAGHSSEVDSATLSAQENDDAGNWCTATAGLGDGDFGTPRLPASCTR
jgi:uncharacterized protein